MSNSKKQNPKLQATQLRATQQAAGISVDAFVDFCQINRFIEGRG